MPSYSWAFGILNIVLEVDRSGQSEEPLQLKWLLNMYLWNYFVIWKIQEADLTILCNLQKEKYRQGRERTEKADKWQPECIFLHSLTKEFC